MANSANEKSQAVSDESLRRETLRKYREQMFGGKGRCEFNDQGVCVNECDRYCQMAKSALDRAHEIRKFEIDLLWKRAGYVATFQAFLFAALGVSFSADNAESEPFIYVLRLIICVVGAFSSLFWFSINKGSRFWSQNWERHIDFLEDEFEGKLYKTVLSGDKYKSYSVSRVNISISVLFLSTWLVLTVISSFDVIKWLYCVVSQLGNAKASTIAEAAIGFVGILALVTVCVCCCFDLRTRFSSVVKGDGEVDADSFFVKRQSPKTILDSPLNEMPIRKEIWRYIWCKKS